MRRGGSWEDTVIATARMLGWSVMHIRPVFDGKRKRWVTGIQADGKGWPDLTLVRERMVFAELKSGKGQPTPEQRAWLDRLARAGQECYVWRDDDYDAVVATLRRRTPAPASTYAGITLTWTPPDEQAITGTH